MAGQVLKMGETDMTEDNDKITPKEVTKKLLHIGDMSCGNNVFIRGKYLSRILLAAMDSVETYWASNNEKAIQEANKERRAWRRLAERLAK